MATHSIYGSGRNHRRHRVSLPLDSCHGSSAKLCENGAHDSTHHLNLVWSMSFFLHCRNLWICVHLHRPLEISSWIALDTHSSALSRAAIVCPSSFHEMPIAKTDCRQRVWLQCSTSITACEQKEGG